VTISAWVDREVPMPLRTFEKRLATCHAIGYPTTAWTRRQLREALGVDRRYYYLIHHRMTHLINNLGTLSMSSLKRCLAVAGYWSMASIVSTLPAASALPAARQPSSGDFNELTDLAKTPQADCERCYYLYAFRLMFPIPNRYVNIGDSARKNGCASFVSPPDQLLGRLVHHCGRSAATS